MNELLSIIVPSYNMEKYPPKHLGSLIVDDPAWKKRLESIKTKTLATYAKRRAKK